MKLTWLGHAAFHVEFNHQSILIDPFFTGNPKYPEGFVDKLGRVDLIALTHAHGDHYGDTLELAKRFDATVAAQYDLAMYIGAQGHDKLEPMNKGGSIKIGGTTVTMVTAHHSSALLDDNGRPLSAGDPAGLIFAAAGEKTLYHAGDTAVFSDMALIQRLYEPKIGLLPCGDRVTMGPYECSVACNELLNLETIVPIHWGTFDFMPGDPQELKQQVTRGTVEIMDPGQSLSL